MNPQSERNHQSAVRDPQGIRNPQSEIRNPDRLAARGDLDPFRVSPEAFETVEEARLAREDVDDEVEVVEQNPFGAVVAFDVRRLDFGREPPSRRPRWRALPRVGAGRDHEEVGEAGRLRRSRTTRSTAFGLPRAPIA